LRHDLLAASARLAGSALCGPQTNRLRLTWCTAFQHSDNRHQDAATHAPAGDVAKYRSKVEAAVLGKQADKLKDYAANTASENAGDGVS
jgi:hypothetical protein